MNRQFIREFLTYQNRTNHYPAVQNTLEHSQHGTFNLTKGQLY